MHLLVPGAYRLAKCEFFGFFNLASLNAPSGAGCLPTKYFSVGVTTDHPSQCTFWCRVLTDPRTRGVRPTVMGLNAPSGAGCLPTKRNELYRVRGPCGLNAPSGAGCLPTPYGTSQRRARCRVSMHLLVPGAYRRKEMSFIAFAGLVVSMHLLVPGAYRLLTGPHNAGHGAVSQCTFWCRVLTDAIKAGEGIDPFLSLNAPSGAGCLPTIKRSCVRYQ